MIKCIAIDDEPLALRQIKSYIERSPQLELCALCSSPFEAQEALQANNIDLIFADINMPDMSGIDFVRGLQSPPMVIFTTAYSEYAIEGFRLDAVDYLLKPFSFADFERAVGKAVSLYELKQLRDAQQVTAESTPAPEGENNEYISIKADYKVTLVRYSDIIYIESVGEYVRLHLTNASPITTLFRLKIWRPLYLRINLCAYIVHTSSIWSIYRPMPEAESISTTMSMSPSAATIVTHSANTSTRCTL